MAFFHKDFSLFHTFTDAKKENLFIVYIPYDSNAK